MGNSTHTMSKTAFSGLTDYAATLAAGIQTIPAEEVIACLRGNLTATRKIRMGKDQPEGIEEPDFAVRQKAVDTILSITVPARKAIDAPKAETTEAQRPTPGKLKA